MTERVNAKKAPMGLAQARALLRDVDEVYSASRGRPAEHLDLRKGKPDTATLTRLLIGPTGKLRAPTFRVGRTLLVGFDRATYVRVLG